MPSNRGCQKRVLLQWLGRWRDEWVVFCDRILIPWRSPISTDNQRPQGTCWVIPSLLCLWDCILTTNMGSYLHYASYVGYLLGTLEALSLTFLQAAVVAKSTGVSHSAVQSWWWGSPNYFWIQMKYHTGGIDSYIPHMLPQEPKMHAIHGEVESPPYSELWPKENKTRQQQPDILCLQAPPCPVQSPYYPLRPPGSKLWFLWSQDQLSPTTSGISLSLGSWSFVWTSPEWPPSPDREAWPWALA